jgi:hypothetical protein
MNNASAAAQLAGLARLFRRGAYTNDPSDANYGNHHHTSAIPDSETLRAVYPATISAGGLRTYGTVRQTDAGVYIDPGRLPESGALARLGNAALSNAGLNTARRYDASAVDMTETAPRLTITTPDGLEVRARTDGFVGRPSELSPVEQLRNAWRFARG